MRVLRSSSFAVIAISLLRTSAGAEQQFPQVRVSTNRLEGVWLASPIVAVGEVTDITFYGKQTLERLPAPTMPDIHDLYWCQGYFSAVAVVKGELKEKRKRYLWGTTISGCELVDKDPKHVEYRSKTKFWFLRDEGEFLRPTFDYGTYRFGGVFTSWSDGPPLPARSRMGALLLMPAANSDSLDDYARYLWDVGDIACELLGKPECIREFRGQEEMGNPALRESACNFLKGQLEADCQSR